MGTNTDPYQRAEGRYKLMRGDHRGAGRLSEPVLDPDEGHPHPARRRPPAASGRGHHGLGGVLDRNPRRNGLAGDRARYAASEGEDRRDRDAHRSRHPDRCADGADPARGSRIAPSSCARWWRRRSMRERPTCRRSCCICAPACERSSCPGSRKRTRTSSRAISRCTGSPTDRRRSASGSGARCRRWCPPRVGSVGRSSRPVGSSGETVNGHGSPKPNSSGSSDRDSSVVGGAGREMMDPRSERDRSRRGRGQPPYRGRAPNENHSARSHSSTPGSPVTATEASVGEHVARGAEGIHASCGPWERIVPAGSHRRGPQRPRRLSTSTTGGTAQDGANARRTSRPCLPRFLEIEGGSHGPLAKNRHGQGVLYRD